MISIKLAGKESCDMAVRILCTRVRMTHDCSHSGIIICELAFRGCTKYLAGIGGFTFQCYRYWDGMIYIKLAGKESVTWPFAFCIRRFA
jgi:hypothetical protein